MFLVKVVVSCPKANEERGRVERRIRLIREMLGNTHSGTVTENFDIITPNRILLGRNNRRGMSGEVVDFESISIDC